MRRNRDEWLADRTRDPEMNGRLLIAGAWEDGAVSDPVTNKYSGAIIGSVAVADEKQIRRAIAAAGE